MLNLEGVVKLKSLHVNGLKANIISISQLSDENIAVNFDKDRCIVIDKIRNCVITGNRTSDNHYQMCTSNNFNRMMTKTDKIEL
jgi:hypothetical protein